MGEWIETGVEKLGFPDRINSMLDFVFPLESTLPSANIRWRKRRNALIIGHVNKTQIKSLLFQAAVSKASKNRAVLYIAPQEFRCLPPHVHGMKKLSPDNGELLKIVYAKSYSSLVQYLARIHFEDKSFVYTTIILEDIDYYLLDKDQKIVERTMAKLFALLVDVADYYSKKTPSKSGRCSLMIGAEDTSICRQVAPLFIPEIWVLTSGTNDEDCDRFTLEVSQDEITVCRVEYEVQHLPFSTPCIKRQTAVQPLIRLDSVISYGKCDRS